MIVRTDRFSGLGRKVLQTGWTGMADRTYRYIGQDRQVQRAGQTDSVLASNKYTFTVAIAEITGKTYCSAQTLCRM